MPAQRYAAQPGAPRQCLSVMFMVILLSQHAAMQPYSTGRTGSHCSVGMASKNCWACSSVARLHWLMSRASTGSPCWLRALDPAAIAAAAEGPVR